MLADLDAACIAIEADADVRVVVVTGAGEKAFSAGADVVAWSALVAARHVAHLDPDGTAGP